MRYYQRVSNNVNEFAFPVLKLHICMQKFLKFYSVVSMESTLPEIVQLILYEKYSLLKNHVSKDGDLIKHVELIDTNIQLWVHLNYDTKYSRRDQDLWMDTSCLWAALNPKGCTKPCLLNNHKICSSFFLFPFLFWNPSISPELAISLS